jgi:hypothetical protein
MGEGRTDDAIRYAHTLKGVSANLSLPAVQFAAAEVEQCLKQHGAPELNESMGRLEEALEIITHGYQERFPEKQEPDVESALNDPDAASNRSLPDSLRPSLAQVLALARRHNPQAESAFVGLRSDLLKANYALEVRRVDTAFETFDFKTITSQIEALLAK